jgi:hypothetical protein
MWCSTSNMLKYTENNPLFIGYIRKTLSKHLLKASICLPFLVKVISQANKYQTSIYLCSKNLACKWTQNNSLRVTTLQSQMNFEKIPMAAMLTKWERSWETTTRSKWQTWMYLSISRREAAQPLVRYSESLIHIFAQKERKKCLIY